MIHHEVHSAAEPQPNEENGFHHEGTKSTKCKNNFSEPSRPSW